ncbi:hypothetical protein [Streptomyces sp. NPDC003660]
MSPTLHHTALAAALVLPATLLSGCSLVQGGASCEGSVAAREALAAEPVLSSPPGGATDPANYRGVGVSTGCDDDSPGPAWVHADRLYTFPGSRRAVVDHYARVAAAGGWRRDTASRADAACWTRTADDRHLVLAVDFQLGGWTPAPELGNGIGYEVTVGSNADGGDHGEGCAD